MNDVYARTSPFDAEVELASRELARRTVLHFTTYTYPEFVPEAFHEHVCETLDAVVAGDIQRLIIFAPPQHGKSELVSVRLPAFWLAKHPEMPVLITSYGAGLAHEKAAASRTVMNTPMYYHLFPEIFRPAPKYSRAANVPKNYNTRIYASGINSSITGRGGGLGIIDDPVKDWMQAYSSTFRERAWQWWKGTFRPRIWARGRICVIMTRWHEDDLAGRILNEAGERWHVIRYPALAETLEERIESDRKYHGKAVNRFENRDPLDREPGDPLCPRRFDLPALLDIQHDVGPRAWASEYQGTPRPVEGNLVSMDHIKIVEDAPWDEFDMWVRYWDKGGLEGRGARTAGLLMARTKQKTYYVLDVTKGQWSPFEREGAMRNTVVKDNEQFPKVRTYFEHEGGSEGLFGAAFTLKNLAGFHVQSDRPSTSKETRFLPVASQIEAGNVYFLNRHWTWELVDELLMFPHGTFKDQADALSGAFRKLALGGWSRRTGG